MLQNIGCTFMRKEKALPTSIRGSRAILHMELISLFFAQKFPSSFDPFYFPRCTAASPGRLLQRFSFKQSQGDYFFSQFAQSFEN